LRPSLLSHCASPNADPFLAVQDDLRNMGVIVFDKEKTWKLAGGGGGGGGGYGGAPGGGYGGGGGGSYGGSGGGSYGGGVGPSGHDYTRDDDGSVAVDVPKIDAILAQRMQAKMGRDFATADRLRVRSCATDSPWSAPESSSARPREEARASGRKHARQSASARASERKRTRVRAQAHARARCLGKAHACGRPSTIPRADHASAPLRPGSHLAGSPAAQDELKSIGVMVFDKEKTWKAAGAARTPYASGGGGPGGPGGGGYYQPPPQAAPYGGGGGGGYGAPPPPAPAASYGAPPAGRGGAYDAGRSGQRGYEDKESYNRAVLEGRVQYRAPEDEEDQRFARRDRERGRPEGERSRDRDRDRDRDREYDQRERPRRPEDGGAPR
jgi:hypothetical protein